MFPSISELIRTNQNYEPDADARAFGVTFGVSLVVLHSHCGESDLLHTHGYKRARLAVTATDKTTPCTFQSINGELVPVEWTDDEGLRGPNDAGACANALAELNVRVRAALPLVELGVTTRPISNCIEVELEDHKFEYLSPNAFATSQPKLATEIATGALRAYTTAFSTVTDGEMGCVPRIDCYVRRLVYGERGSNCRTYSTPSLPHPLIPLYLSGRNNVWSRAQMHNMACQELELNTRAPNEPCPPKVTMPNHRPYGRSASLAARGIFATGGTRRPPRSSRASSATLTFV